MPATDLHVLRNSPQGTTTAVYHYDSLADAVKAAPVIAAREVAPGFSMVGAVAKQWIARRPTAVASFDRVGTVVDTY